MKSLYRYFFLAVFIMVMGAGCGRSVVPTATSTPSIISEPIVVEPKRWDHEETPTGIRFTIPEGYWLYTHEALRTHYLIAGTPPAPGSADPGPDVMPKAVAAFVDLQNDPEEYPEWDSFAHFAAQLLCPSGSTDADFTSCGNQRKTIETGRTQGNFLYEQFTYNRLLKKTQAARGTRTFISVEYGDGAQDGMIAVVHDDTRLEVIREMVKSMRRASP